MTAPKFEVAAPRIPEAAVVIPTRNRWELLERALRSVLGQRGVAVEVVVVDDASDQSAGNMPGLEDGRVKLVRRERRGGIAATRNTGMHHTDSRWIAFLDDDDVWAPWRLRTLIDAAEETGAGWAYSSALIVDEKLRPLGLAAAPDPATLVEKLVHGNAIPGGGSNVITRSTILRRCQGFDESFSFAEDWELWLRLSQSVPSAAVTEPLLAYFHHLGSWTLNADSSDYGDVDRIAVKHAEVVARLNGSIGRAGLDRLLAHGLWWAGRPVAASRSYLMAGLRNRDPRALIRAPGALLTPKVARRLRIVKPVPATPEWLSAAGVVGSVQR
jgi:glycosyltransferase involved in cell wall biosynthesis